jgi:hypothetical protein
MLRTLAAAGLVALAAGCQSTPQPANEIVIEVDDDGNMRVVSAGGSPEDQALAALMQSALDGDFGAAEEPAPLAEDEIWRDDGQGNLMHIQSGAQCPQRWGEYTRTRTHVFRPDGLDVGCNFAAPDGKVMTFYIYESAETLADELDGAFESMKTRQPVSTDARFGSLPESTAYVGRSLAYEAADGTQMRTSVALADGGGWRLKIRLTCEARLAVQAENAAGVALIGQADRLNSGKPPAPAVKPSPV